MFNGSFLRVCRILRFVKKNRFAVLSLGGPSHGARVWHLGRVPKHRNQWKKQRACYLAPKTLSWCIFRAFISKLWFPYSSFQQVLQLSIPSPVEEGTSKIRDTTGTVFIQGPSIVLLVCVQDITVCEKIRFCLHESGWTKAWCPGLVSRPNAKA